MKLPPPAPPDQAWEVRDIRQFCDANDLSIVVRDGKPSLHYPKVGTPWDAIIVVLPHVLARKAELLASFGVRAGALSPAQRKRKQDAAIAELLKRSASSNRPVWVLLPSGLSVVFGSKPPAALQDEYTRARYACVEGDSQWTEILAPAPLA